MHRIATTAAVCVAVLLALAGCTDNQQAEMKGQDVGEALCDVRDADDQAQAEAAIADVEDEIDDLNGDYASLTAEDRADIRENLDDLAEHVQQGDEALVQQDLAAIRVNVEDIEGDVGSVAQATASGVIQGLDDCI